MKSITFGKDNIIPKPFDRRVLLWEATAVAKAAMETGVAQEPVELEQYRKVLEARLEHIWGPTKQRTAVAAD